MTVSHLNQTHSNHDHPKLGRFLIVSMAVHIIVVLALTGGWLGSSQRAKPPVYFVDLIHKPVLNPQAGRPEPRPQEKPKPAPVKTATPEPVKTTPKPDPVKPAPVKPEAKPVAKAAPTVQPAPQAEKLAEQRRKSAIDELRQKQAHQAEIDALRQRLAKLQQSSGAAAVPQDVPIGMPEGTGDEVGVSVLSHIQAFIQQNWALSPYLLDRSRIGSIEAKVLLAFSASGKLEHYRIIEPSGDTQFDDSIKRAIIKSQQLEHKLPQKTELTVVFNLKQMAEARR